MSLKLRIVQRTEKPKPETWSVYVYSLNQEWFDWPLRCNHHIPPRKPLNIEERIEKYKVGPLPVVEFEILPLTWALV